MAQKTHLDCRYCSFREGGPAFKANFDKLVEAARGANVTVGQLFIKLLELVSGCKGQRGGKTHSLVDGLAGAGAEAEDDAEL